MTIFGANIFMLNKFLKHFSSCFSKKQLAMFIPAIYVLFKDYKTNSLEVMVKANHMNYQKLQYFFSGSKWNCPYHQTQTIRNHSKAGNYSLHQRGFLAIDDAGCPTLCKENRGRKMAMLRATQKRKSFPVEVGITEYVNGN